MVRFYGEPPYRVVLVHGGPGAAGSLEPFARELSKQFSVAEPFQGADSVEGEILELKEQLTPIGGPFILVGHSWGAWLSFMYAARYPDDVSKLILVASAPFESRYSAEISERRMNRLSSEEIVELSGIISKLGKSGDDEIALLHRIDDLFQKCDIYESNGVKAEVSFNGDIFRKVWFEADSMRKSGKLISLASEISSPVVAIHGDYDPHPYEGVQILSSHIKDFKFHLLDMCGHYPWREKSASSGFFQILEREIAGN